MVSCKAVEQASRNAHRYKGIEGLLRRIAFNLGNTPSQTEVKIISCIPIDVSDLQQKIICLEKQLEQARCNRSQVLPVVVNRTRLRLGYPRKSSGASSVRGVRSSRHHPPSINDNTPITSGHRKNQHRTYITQNSSYESPQFLEKSQRWMPDPCQTENRNVSQNLIPEKDRTRLVYYAQTVGSPFTNYKKDINTDKTHDKLEEAINPTDLSSIIERQYRLGKMYVEDDAPGSQLSAPVCRDVPRGAGASDMCSCCHGHFLDVDREMPRGSIYAPNIDSGNIYYDSSFYDIKPVKEKPDTIKRSDMTKRRGPEIDLAFYPEYNTFNPDPVLKPDYLPSHALYSKSVKFQKKRERHTKQIYLQNDSSQTDGLVEFSHVYTKRLPSKYRLKNCNSKPMSRNVACNAHSEINTQYEYYMGPSKLIQTQSVAKRIPTGTNVNPNTTSENAECTNHTTKETECQAESAQALQTLSLSKLRSRNASLHKVTVKSAECLALGVNETECQTEPAKSAHTSPTTLPDSDKTESTLNQIKNILQTVLTEVKTNSRMRAIVEDKETKDAVVQNESVPATDCERFLGSITYSSPFNVNNPYMASYSGGVMPSYCSSMMRQTLTMPPKAMEVAPTDMNCVQNYPVFIQRTLATHACCTDRPGQAKQTSTNSLQDPPKKRFTETEHLIKEIYKSIALNVDCPMKTSTSRTAIDVKSTKVGKSSPGETAAENTTALGREEIIYRGNVTTRFATKMTESPSSHSALNMRPHRRGGSFHQRPKHTTSSQRRQFTVADTGPGEVSHESASETESDVNIAQPAATSSNPAPKVIKKGFFGKVMSSMMKRMRRKEQQQPQNPENRMNAIAEDSDSEYETLANQKAEKPVKHVSYAPTDYKTVLQCAQAARPRATTSRTRRMSETRTAARARPARPERLQHERLVHRSPRMPRYVPPRGAGAGSSRGRRAALRPRASRPATPPDYMRRVPHNEYDWRTTPARPVDECLSSPTNEYKAAVQPRNAGLKITNKTWMRKPVHHLGFACGPEKTKILMQRY